MTPFSTGCYTYEALLSILPGGMDTMRDLLDYADGIQERFQRWWQTAGRDTDFDQPGKVYYGEVTLLEVLERTGWHSGQHTRQLALVVESLGLNSPLKKASLTGFHATAKHIAAKAVSPSSETMRTI